MVGFKIPALSSVEAAHGAVTHDSSSAAIHNPAGISPTVSPANRGFPTEPAQAVYPASTSTAGRPPRGRDGSANAHAAGFDSSHSTTPTTSHAMPSSHPRTIQIPDGMQRFTLPDDLRDYLVYRTVDKNRPRELYTLDAQGHAQATGMHIGPDGKRMALKGGAGSDDEGQGAAPNKQAKLAQQQHAAATGADDTSWEEDLDDVFALYDQLPPLEHAASGTPPSHGTPQPEHATQASSQAGTSSNAQQSSSAVAHSQSMPAPLGTVSLENLFRDPGTAIRTRQFVLNQDHAPVYPFPKELSSGRLPSNTRPRQYAADLVEVLLQRSGYKTTRMERGGSTTPLIMATSARGEKFYVHVSVRSANVTPTNMRVPSNAPAGANVLAVVKFGENEERASLSLCHFQSPFVWTANPR